MRGVATASSRFYDLNVWTTKKRVEKLRYMHRNPGKRGLVESPEQRRWSSYRFYLLDETGLVRVNEGWTKISFRDRSAKAKTLTVRVRGSRPCKKRKDGAPRSILPAAI